MFDCLIPFFNEDAKRLQSVISTLLSIAHVGYVICIDDGSQNDTYQKVMNMFRFTKRVRVVRYVKNVGKSEALRKGLAYVQSDTVLTLDADMSDIDSHELTLAYQEFRMQNYDLLILQLIDEPKQARFFRGDILLSGQRFIKTGLLRDMYKAMHPHGYALEMATNHYVMNHKKMYGIMPFGAHNIQPVDKLGIGKGIIKEIRQLSDIFSTVGLLGFLNVYFGFGK